MKLVRKGFLTTYSSHLRLVLQTRSFVKKASPHQSLSITLYFEIRANIKNNNNNNDYNK